MSDNKLYIAAAGAGKTTFLVHHACDLAKDDNQKSIAIITYTRKNQQEIKIDSLRNKDSFHPT